MRQKILLTALLLCLLLSWSACGTAGQTYLKFQADFAGVFDTSATIIGYAKTQSEFTKHAEIVHEELKRLHRLYDIYNDYSGVNNLKTVNDNAGIAPVKVERDIIDLLKIAKQAYADTDGIVNAALGPVLTIWHDYRAHGIENIESAMLPPMELLEEAAQNTNMDDLVIDEQNGTVFLAKAGMSLDVGSIAKGYATEQAAKAAEEKGMKSALLSIGGNIVAIGKPLDDVRDRWGVGIQDPHKSVDGTAHVADTVYITDAAVVSSGSYQRFYIVEGKAYHHLIDPSTLMPANRYEAVTVIHENSYMADILSTAMFILPEQQGDQLLKAHNAAGLWIHFDGSMTATTDYAAVSKELGNYSSTDNRPDAAS